jgi:aminoglycoside 3-N-acetyltransferase I
VGRQRARLRGTMAGMEVRRLLLGERDLARRLFALMASVFEETASEELPDAYIDRLLVRKDFWALVALDGDVVVGGLTAHTLMMTRSVSSEVFLYDLAVAAERQRQGIGRHLVTALCDGAAKEGIDVVFVPADDEDEHALDFYRAVGGTPAAVTIFTFERPAGRAPVGEA